MSVHALGSPLVAPPARSTSWGSFLKENLDTGWRPTEWEPATLSFRGALNSPMTSISLCLRPGCGIVVDGFNGWCNGCRKLRSKLGDSLLSTPRVWKGAASPDKYVKARTFSLEGLDSTLRDEILFALQEGDREAIAIRPLHVSLLVAKLPARASSVLDLDEGEWSGMQLALLRAMKRRVGRLRLAFQGDDGTSGDIWECALVGLASAPDRPYPAVSGQLNFTVIRQQWLRDATKGVLRALRPPVTDGHRYIQAAAIASDVLSKRPHGERPDLLGLADMTTICQAFKAASHTTDFTLYSESHRRALLGWWRRLINYARRFDLLEDIPGAFAMDETHQISSVDTNEDAIGRVIPEEWIAHFDGHISMLGESSNYSANGWTAADLRRMYRTFYQVLRDTGRRPSEVARLSDRPLEYSDGQPSLIYDNKKARRYGRRLPIDTSTADVISEWAERLKELPVPPECEGFLFPAPGARNRARRGHMSADLFRKMFSAWVKAIPAADHGSEAFNSFPVDQLDPYGFRHAYAQRHADNGTPVDVLRDLMDHKDISTTMGYYKVTLRRKQEAVHLIAKLAVDRNAAPAPFGSDLAYERSSVATPYGNCTEPSNVKAGGKSCPIRFQCAGCGFFRPDPSYLAAIEEQVTQLRADKAMAAASDVAQWVLDNFDEQISSYDKIRATMRSQLDAMPEDERSAVETSCSVLRIARQAVLIPAESLLRRPDDIE